MGRFKIIYLNVKRFILEKAGKTLNFGRK